MKKTILLITLSFTAFAQGGFRGQGRYEIVSPLSNKVIDLDRNDQRTVIQYDARQTDNQYWDFIDAGGGYFYIRNAMNGNALSVQDDKNSTPLVGAPFGQSNQQRWRVESGDNGTGILVNANGKVIDIPYGSTNNGVKLNSYNRNNEVNQRWSFREVQGGGRSNTSRYDDRRYDDRRRSGGSRYDSTANPTSAYNAGPAPTDGVCFYRDRDFRGDSYCMNLQDEQRRISTPLGSYNSVRFFGRARAVQVFDREDFRGNSSEIRRDQRDLAGMLRNAPRSLRVY